MCFCSPRISRRSCLSNELSLSEDTSTGGSKVTGVGVGMGFVMALVGTFADAGTRTAGNMPVTRFLKSWTKEFLMLASLLAGRGGGGCISSTRRNVSS